MFSLNHNKFQLTLNPQTSIIVTANDSETVNVAVWNNVNGKTTSTISRKIKPNELIEILNNPQQSINKILDYIKIKPPTNFQFSEKSFFITFPNKFTVSIRENENDQETANVFVWQQNGSVGEAGIMNAIQLINFLNLTAKQ